MIRLKDVYKEYDTRSGPRPILNNVNLEIRRGEKIGILGGNGAGKSTLIRLISGAESPTRGTIERTMSVSWPLAFGGAFQGSLTGLDNVKFICRVYGKDFNEARPFVEEFTELGMYLREPVKNYSSGMRAKLAFAISMTVDFDCYLIDEVMAVGDKRFKQKCNDELFDKRKDKGLIIVSHSPTSIRKLCKRACVLRNGVIQSFEDVETAYSTYNLVSGTV